MRKAAQNLGCCVVGTGKIDYVSDGTRLFSINNGHPMMTRVTGMGCVATSIAAAFLAVQPIPLMAAVHAMALVGIAGEWAAELAQTEGPGTFRVKFLDSFDRLELGNCGALIICEISDVELESRSQERDASFAHKSTASLP